MPNPLDRHLQTLRATEARPEAVDRAVAALRRPQPTRLVPLSAGVAAVSAVLLWPRPGSGGAWAQILNQPTPPRYILRRSVVRDGRALPWLTVWNDAPEGARRVQEVATVGRPAYAQETIHSRQGRYVRVYRDYAIFSRHEERLPQRDLYFSEPEDLVRNNGYREVAVDRDVETRVGQADRYAVEITAWTVDPATHKLIDSGVKNRLTAYTAPGTKRLLGWDYSINDPKLPIGFQTTVEYPDRIEPSVFAIPHPAGLRVYDLDAIRAAASHPLKSPLRLAVQDANRRVWVFSKEEEASVVGAPLGEKVWTLKDYNGMGAYGWRSPFRAMGVRLAKQVEKVDVRMGAKILRNVPVFPIDNLETVASALKMSPFHGAPSPHRRSSKARGGTNRAASP